MTIREPVKGGLEAIATGSGNWADCSEMIGGRSDRTGSAWMLIVD
jgi:hypothetical protein